MTEQTAVSGGRDIFFVSNSVDEMGGVTTWTHQMARQFAERDHRVHVVGIVPAPEGRRQEFPGDLPYGTTTLYDGHPRRCARCAGSRASSTRPSGSATVPAPPVCGSRPRS